MLDAICVKTINKLPSRKEKIGGNCTVGLKTVFKIPFQFNFACTDNKNKKIHSSNIAQIRITGYQEQPLIEVVTLADFEVLVGKIYENNEAISLYLNS